MPSNQTKGCVKDEATQWFSMGGVCVECEGTNSGGVIGVFKWGREVQDRQENTQEQPCKYIEQLWSDVSRTAL